MTRMPNLFFILFALIMLTGCVSREQADAKLGKGCAAAAETFLDDGIEIKKIEKSSFKKSKEFGEGYREVRLDVIESDGWYEPEKEYACVFAEEFGLFNMSHDASIYQVVVDGELYGKKGEEIVGSFQNFLKLTETVERAMDE